jgi:hypothetical protein
MFVLDRFISYSALRLTVLVIDPCDVRTKYFGTVPSPQHTVLANKLSCCLAGRPTAYQYLFVYRLSLLASRPTCCPTGCRVCILVNNCGNPLRLCLCSGALLGERCGGTLVAANAHRLQGFTRGVEQEFLPDVLGWSEA